MNIYEKKILIDCLKSLENNNKPMQPPSAQPNYARCRTPNSKSNRNVFIYWIVTSFLLFYYLYISYCVICAVNNKSELFCELLA